MGRNQNCSRMRYKQSSRIPRHFVSPKFWLFYAKSEFFNSHEILRQSLSRGRPIDFSQILQCRLRQCGVLAFGRLEKKGLRFSPVSQSP